MFSCSQLSVVLVRLVRAQVSCDVAFCVKSGGSGKTSKQPEVFEVSPSRAQIAPQSHTYAVVTFSPSAMQVTLIVPRRMLTLCLLTELIDLHCVSKYWTLVTFLSNFNISIGNVRYKE